MGRTNDFREDYKVTTGSASLSDFKGSGYDRGHLAPAGDMKWSSTAMSESFYMSNMSPQKPGFNRGIWKKLESRKLPWFSRSTSRIISQSSKRFLTRAGYWRNTRC
jgi:endonuclease G